MFDRGYSRVLLKISGEVLKGKAEYGYDHKVMDRIASDILEVDQQGTQVCMTVGGGNFFRGSKEPFLERPTADYIGILATIMNALALQDVLNKKGASAKVLSSVPVDTICETYSRDKALNYMENSSIVIFAGGTGNPFVSTDTSGVYRAIEMKCDALFKGTQVSGVYSEDPKIHKNTQKYDNLKYDDVIKQELGVMDLPSVFIAREHKLPILVFSILKSGEFNKVVCGQGNSTLIN